MSVWKWFSDKKAVLWPFVTALVFKTFQFLKMCPIFVVFVDNFGKRYEINQDTYLHNWSVLRQR